MEHPRVLLVGHSPHLHGAEYSLLRLAGELRHRYNISVLAPAGGAFEAAINALDLDFYALDPRYPFALLNSRQSALPAFVQQLHNEGERLKQLLPRFELVHSNTFYVWEGALLAAHWGVPHVWNLREIPESSPTWRAALGWPRTYQLVESLSDAAVCVSEALKRVCPPVLQEISTVVHNGLDAKSLWSREASREWMASLGIPANAKIALTIGNFIPEKGHARLLEQLAPLLQKHSEWHCLWVGEQHFCFADIQRRIGELGLRNRIHCPGPIAQVGQKICGADLYILPSLTEAFPTVLLEARCAGVPFIASDCGGAREIAVKGGGWCCADHGEMAAQLAAAFKGELAFPPLQEGAFTMKSMADGYDSVYQKLLAQPVDEELAAQRQLEIKTLTDLSIDLVWDLRLQQGVNRLKALRGLGRFFRWWFR